MIHNRAGRKLKRTHSHRKALLKNLATSLFKSKKIKTTLAKAKESRMFVEKIITRAKNAVINEKESGKINVHARREVAKIINDKTVIKTLFTEIAEKVATRPGGYTRVVKLGQRLGDGAHMAILELVDFNTGKEEKKSTPTKVDRKKRINQKSKKKTEIKTEVKEEKPAEEAKASA